MRRLFFLFLIINSFVHLMAGTVSKEQALRIATSFMAQHGIQKPLELAQTDKQKTRSAGEDLYYIFNADHSFVIVGGDDHSPQVLGYSLHNRFEATDLPDNLATWLDGHAKTRSAEEVPLHDPVPDLITSHWTQRDPYNTYCPTLNGKTTLTGCVATAMGQVMYYHKWPTGETKGIPHYTSKTNNIEIDSLPPTTFAWHNILPAYNSNYTQTQKEAVAHLMRYCSSSVEADYKDGSTAAYNTMPAKALRNYFGYGNGVRFVSRIYYDDSQWDAMIYNEISHQRPIIYSGQREDDSGGHEFVVHGYDGNGYYAVNWGWGGNGDGYYLLSGMNPPTSSEPRYNLRQAATIGITPEDIAETNPANLLTIIRGAFVDAPSVSKPHETESTTYTCEKNANGGFEFRYAIRILSQLASEETFDIGFALCKDNEVIETTAIRENITLTPGNGMIYWGTRGIENLSDGDYAIKTYCRLSGTEEWYKCYGCDKWAILIHAEGNTVKLQVADTTTSIHAITTHTADADEPATYYDLHGRKVNADYKGIVIKRFANGTTQKQLWR